MRESASHAAFATTQWSVVLAAGATTSAESREALEQLCRAYWFPLYAYLRRRGHSSHDAQDLVQDCLTHLIERRAFRSVDPDKGRFRSFLIACLNHCVADAGDRNRAQKRGGGTALLALDEAQADQLYQLEARKDLGADRLFDDAAIGLALGTDSSIAVAITSDFGAAGFNAIGLNWGVKKALREHPLAWPGGGVKIFENCYGVFQSVCYIRPLSKRS